MNVEDFIESLRRRFEQAPLFYGHGTDNAADEAFYLTFAALELDFSLPRRQWRSRRLRDQEIARLERLARSRIVNRVPVAYLVGRAWFAGLPFIADRRALIPRSPVAELIRNQFAGVLASEPARVLDLCCGGGCIGIACAMSFPGAEVDLSDLSEAALAQARENIRLHEVGKRVRAIRSDLFEELNGRYDLIIANPPYVDPGEVAGLPAEYCWEPVEALQCAGQGLSLAVRILQQAADYLTDSGVLIMEVGYNWQALQRRLPAIPLLWLSFSEGGEGVLAISRRDLLKYADQLVVWQAHML